MKIRLRDDQKSSNDHHLGIVVDGNVLVAPRDLGRALRTLRLRPRSGEELLVQLQMNPQPIAKEIKIAPERFTAELDGLIHSLQDQKKVSSRLFEHPEEGEFMLGAMPPRRLKP